MERRGTEAEEGVETKIRAHTDTYRKNCSSERKNVINLNSSFSFLSFELVCERTFLISDVDEIIEERDRLSKEVEVLKSSHATEILKAKVCIQLKRIS